MLTRILFMIMAALGLASGTKLPTTGSPFSAVLPARNLAIPQDFSLEFFPVAPHHVGDNLSVRVTYSSSEEIAGREITVSLADSPETKLETVEFSRYSRQAVLYWILPTGDRPPGFINFLFTIPALNLSWQAGVNLLPAPGGRPEAWAQVHTNCCNIYYLPGTDAADDIAEIQQVLETKTNEALAQFASQLDPGQPTPTEPLSLVLIPSLIGQGGFATDFAVMTYSDRNWAGTDFSIIAHHEIVHVLDRQLNDGARPSLFAEGLAVYFAGGHYKQADLLNSASALLAADRYIPITDFVDDFYAAQHEISYLQAGGLVAYLVNEWGLDQFLDFYFSLSEANRDSESISTGLEEQFGMTLAELEEDFIATLQSLNPTREAQDNVWLTIDTYDLMRRYQKTRVPSAYFRNAWWPPVDQALEMDYVGDYAAREKSPVDVVIENLFLETYPALNAGDNSKAEETLAEIERLLDLADSSGAGFSHYSIGWPLPHPLLIAP